MTENMSTEARNALIGTKSNRQGATVPARTPEAVILELQDAGLIGKDLGLTRRGTIARERLVNALMDAAF